MQGVPTNEQLVRLMTEAGFVDNNGELSRKRFAREVSAASGRKTYSHTYVARWLSNARPRDDATRTAIREALGVHLGRVIAEDELGFAVPDTTSSDLGLAYPDRPETGVSTVVELLVADLADASALRRAPTNSSAWNDASLAWLVSSQKPFGEAKPGKVGPADVERLRAMRMTFDRLDGSFGGDHARGALVHYLRGELPRLLRADGQSEVRKALFVAAGEATQLAAWMSYDSGRHGLAQRYFIQALGLADAGGDRLLAASVLDAMSHQASFLGKYRESAQMARAARLGTESAGVPILTSHFYAMEARALARTGDAADCDRAMTGAVEHFERAVDGEGPEWIGYFDASELAAELAHCNRDLGRPDQAIEYATQALGAAPEESIRSNFFVAMVLADAHVDRGDIEEGVRVAEQAFSAGDALQSARCQGYVSEFRDRLRRHRSSPIVREFASTVRGHHLWTPASGPQ